MYVCIHHETPLDTLLISPNLALLTFYVQTWDEYHTKTLTLGLVSGPVEGILTLCVVYAVTALKGGSFWQRSMFECLGVANTGAIPNAVYDLPWQNWYMVYGGIVLVVNTYQRYVQPPPPQLIIVSGGTH